MTEDGRILSSFISGATEAGELRVGGFTTTVRSIEAAAAFDASRNEFSVEALNFDTDALTGNFIGVVKVFSSPASTLEGVSFSMHSDRAIATLDDYFGAPLSLTDLSASGEYQIEAAALALQSFTANVSGAQIVASASIAGDGAGSPAFKGALDVFGDLDPETLMQLWPVTMAMGARDFVVDRIPTALFSDLEVRADFPAGSIRKGERPPDESLLLTFRARDAEVHYAPGMTPLKGLSGSGRLTGDTFKFLADGARVGDIRLTSGEVDIPRLSPRAQPSFYRFRAEGGVRDIMTVLDQEPLAVLDAAPFEAEQFGGEAVVNVEIMRPNARIVPRRDYKFSGDAEFVDLRIEDFFAEGALTGAVGRVELKPTSMTVTAEGELGDTPIDIAWNQRFFGDGDRAHIQVGGVADSSTGDFFGLPTRKYLRGPIAFSAEVRGDLECAPVR